MQRVNAPDIDNKLVQKKFRIKMRFSQPRDSGEKLLDWYHGTVTEKPIVEGALRDLEWRLELVAGVSRRNEYVGVMFKHLGHEALGETICFCVEVADHLVAPPPSHQADGIWVHLCHEDSHDPPCTEGARDDVRLSETDRRAFCSDDGSDGSRDVVPSDLLSLGAFIVS